MADLKPTPGEWWAERADEYDRQNGRVHLRSILLAPPLVNGSEPEPVAYVDAEADVRLFLSAPEMYSLVRELAHFENADHVCLLSLRAKKLLRTLHGEQPCEGEVPE